MDEELRRRLRDIQTSLYFVTALLGALIGLSVVVHWDVLVAYWLG